jgi:hypothetical protein
MVVSGGTPQALTARDAQNTCSGRRTQHLLTLFCCPHRRGDARETE